MKNIAILGATSHIAQGLIQKFKKYNQLFLFSRNNDPKYISYDMFPMFKYDVIINCIGLGPINRIFDYYDYFKICETYDNIIINYLKSHNATLYINFSSGAIDNINNIDVNNIKEYDYYAITKLNQEAKHRSLPHMNIIDIRLYSYFSRFANLNDKYLINEIIVAIKNDQILIVDPYDFERDYIHPDDLYDFIFCLLKKRENRSYTLGSLLPISKKSILNFFRNEYNLKWQMSEIKKYLSATGQKINYVPAQIDNVPQYTSLETIEMESKYLLKGKI